MSTKANIIIKDRYNSLVFYRHCHGYPEGVKPTLDKFIEWLKDGKIRDNVTQASGWLIMLGRKEYVGDDYRFKDDHEKVAYEPDDWKVGVYEITNEIHGDIDYLYVIDLDEKEWKKGIQQELIGGEYKMGTKL